MAYVKKDWQDLPSQTTPVTADDLDRIENGIEYNDQRLNGTKPIDNTIYANDFKCKNLLPFNGKNFSIGNLNVYSNNGNLYFNGNLTNIEILRTNSAWKNNLSFTLPAGTYNLSTTLELSSSVHIVISKYSDDSILKLDTGTFTLSSETKVYLAFYLFNQVYSNTQIVSQLEVGSETSPYTPHKNFENEEVYSTNEIRIGTWIDGKPLYRKVIDVGNLPNNTSKTISHNITNIDRIAKFEGFAMDSGKNTLSLITTNLNSVAYQVTCYVTSTNIMLTTGSDRSAYYGYVIIEYTKTTD